MEDHTDDSLKVRGLGERAYHFVREFCVRVGPRPVGSLSERSALEYAQSVLAPNCTTISRQLVDNIPNISRITPLYALSLAALLWVIWETRYWPWAAPLYLFCFFVIPRMYASHRRQYPNRASRRSSFNLVGEQKSGEENHATLILCAHIDSAPVTLIPGDIWPWLHRRLQNLWPSFSVLLCFLGFARLIDDRFHLFPPLAWDIVWVFPVALAFVFVAYELFYFLISRSKDYSPGANDNASGVGIVLALAEYFHRHPLRNLNLRYVLFTAKEAGLLGSQHYAREADLDPKRTYAIVLDKVGTGRDLCYIRGLGYLPPRRASRLLSGLFLATCPGIRGRWQFFGNTDLSPLLRRRIRATALETYGNPWRDRVCHTARDSIEYIEPQALQTTAEALIRVAKLLDQRCG